MAKVSARGSERDRRVYTNANRFARSSADEHQVSGRPITDGGTAHGPLEYKTCRAT